MLSFALKSNQTHFPRDCVASSLPRSRSIWGLA